MNRFLSQARQGRSGVGSGSIVADRQRQVASMVLDRTRFASRVGCGFFALGAIPLLPQPWQETATDPRCLRARVVPPIAMAVGAQAHYNQNGLGCSKP